METSKPNTFMLNLQQAIYLNRYLPQAHSFQLIIEEQKRIRIPKQHSKQYPQQPPARIKSKNNKPKPIQQPIQMSKNKSTNQIKENDLKAFSSQLINVSPALKNCLKVLNKLKKHESAWPFMQPVDPIALHVPNYLRIVKQPMDIRTIENKLKSGDYEHPAQFHADINKIFLNSYKFNPKHTIYYQCTVEFQTYYNQLLHQLKQQTPSNSQTSLQSNYNKQIKNRINNHEQKKKQVEEVKQVRSLLEIKNILKCISKLKSKRLENILKIIYNGKLPSYEHSFQIDLANINQSSYQEVRNYLIQNKLLKK